MLLVLSGCTSYRATDPGRKPSPGPQTLPAASPSPSRVAIAPTPPSVADRAAAEQARQLGLNYRNQERYPEAIAALQKAVELDPSHPSGYVILGWTQHLAGQGDAATTTLRQVLQQQPEHVPALNALGIVYLVGGDLQAAVDTHTQAARLQPNNEIAHYNLSLAYHRLQQYDQAVEQAAIATRLEPENPHPWLALAIAQWDSGDRTAAVRSHRRAVSLNARYGRVSGLARLQRAGFSPEQIERVQDIR